MQELKPEDIDYSKLPRLMPKWFVAWALKPGRLKQLKMIAISIGAFAFVLLAVKIVLTVFVAGPNQSVRAFLVIPALIGETATLLWLTQSEMIQKLKLAWMSPLLLFISSDLQANLRTKSLSQSMGESTLALIVCFITAVGICWYDRKKANPVK